MTGNELHKDIIRQERVLEQAKQKLERIERMREAMARQVEAERKALEAMRKQANDFTSSAPTGTQPPLSSAAPADFASQYDQFNTTANERLKPVTDGFVAQTMAQTLKSPEDPQEQTKPNYQPGDNRMHWSTLDTNPGVPVFASGRFVGSEHGTYTINSKKTYEYAVSARAMPISVGDIINVDVHPTGHGDGKPFTSSTLRYMVTDLYAEPKFHSYHDIIED